MLYPDHPDLPSDEWSSSATSHFPPLPPSGQLDSVVEEEGVDPCSHDFPHLECLETSVKTQSVSIYDDKICRRRTYNNALKYSKE